MGKRIDDPIRMTMEVLEGYVSAFPYQVRRVGCYSLIRADGPIPGKVTVIIGGASPSRHAWIGCLGPGMADGCPVGQDLTPASPNAVLESTRAASGGAGVLYIYRNGGAEAASFELAAAEAAEEGIRIETVRVSDDITSAPPDEIESRRGIAGAFLALKIAGARAEEGATLEEVYAAASKASACVRSVDLSKIPLSCNEIGCENLLQPDATAEEAVLWIIDELAIRSGDEVAALVTRSGPVPSFEPYRIFRRAAQVLATSGIEVHRTYVGEYGTSPDIRGSSITLMRLDEDLRRLLDAPVSCPCFAQF